jgi:hypothetical protein
MSLAESTFSYPHILFICTHGQVVPKNAQQCKSQAQTFAVL